MGLKKIQKILKEKADERVKNSIRKFVPSSQKIYGVKTPVLNEIAKKVQNPNFGLVEKLWKSGSFEEKILAAKILGRIGKEDSNKSLKLIENFSKDISDWAVCDTLGTQGIRKIVKQKQKEIFELSKRLISSKNFWQRRFAIILLIELRRRGFSKEKIKKLIMEKVENDKERYVRKTVVWLKNELD